MIPTVVIGGYLGAGKTTLVNHLLRHAEGRRIAVLVNDFGELAIDADLIEGADGAVLALAGGCVCCSYGDDLVGALQQTVARRPAPDMVLIETSGVGLPASVARSARLASGIAIEGILVLQDAETLQERAQDRYVGDLVRQQMREADLLILNKADLLTPQAMGGLRAWLALQAPGVPVVTASRARVPTDLVLSLRMPGETADEGLDLGSPARAGDGEANGGGGGGGGGRDGDDAALSRWADRPLHAAASAADIFASQTLRFNTPIDLPALLAQLSAPDSGVLRAKGLLTGLDGQRQTLQLAGRRAELSPAPPPTPNGAPDRLLVIRLANAPMLKFPP